MAKKKATLSAVPDEVRGPTAAERNAAINGIIDRAAELHGPGCVERAEKTHSSYLLRRPTGITSLDIAMAGGWPAAAPSVLVGPDGAGKDTCSGARWPRPSVCTAMTSAPPCTSPSSRWTRST